MNLTGLPGLNRPPHRADPAIPARTGLVPRPTPAAGGAARAARTAQTPSVVITDPARLAALGLGGGTQASSTAPGGYGPDASTQGVDAGGGKSARHAGQGRTFDALA